MTEPRAIAVVGGGAAGFFGAIRAAEVAQENGVKANIRIYEASAGYLKKVKISGGGRCNVTHFCFDPRVFCENYPRGSRELISLFHRFQAKDTVEWFRARGVQLVAEEDGRMFPDTNKSSTIIDCFLHEATRLGVQLMPESPISAIEKTADGKFAVQVNGQPVLLADSVLIATGSSPAGYRFAQALGHSINELAPSLFSFQIQSDLLKDLSGTSFLRAQVQLEIPNVEKSFKQEGALLITHWGLSGPAILKLSAWAAREMQKANYQSKLFVNWLGFANLSKAQAYIQSLKDQNAKSQIVSITPLGFTKRFWQNFLYVSGVAPDKRWADLGKSEALKLSENLLAFEFRITGKNRYKEEFVECGGVNLREINFKTMESRLVPNLYFAGELLDVDGVTGGFNFQNAWSTSWVAGTEMASKNLKHVEKN